MKQKLPEIDKLDHPFFYAESRTPADFFPDEHAYYSGAGTNEPWLEGEEAVKRLTGRWQSVKAGLDLLFKERRNKETKLLMIEGIALFIKLVFWTNEQPVRLKNIFVELEQFPATPVNVRDRLEFIMARPAHYHAYIQLSELMVEQEKIFYIQTAIKK